MQSRRFATVVTIVIVVAFFLVAIAPAFAAPPPGALPMHARLVSSAPADKATVDSVEAVVLEFNEDVNPDFVTVRVEGPDGSEAAEDPVVSGRTVTQRLTAPVVAGKHAVTYRVVSSDGHPISGTLTFTSTATAATPTPSETATAPAEPGATASAGSPPAATTPSVPAGEVERSGTSPWLGIGLALGLAALAAVGGATWHRRRTTLADSAGD